MFQFLNFNCWNLEQFSFPYFLANQVLCKWSLDKMHRWWWATGSVSAGSRLATGDCKCSDLMFHHPMSSVEAGRGLVMASGRVGGSEGWEPLNTTPFGSPVVDALLWRLPVHSVEKKSFSAYCNYKKLDPWWRALSKASWDENWLFSPLLEGWWVVWLVWISFDRYIASSDSGRSESPLCWHVFALHEWSGQWFP